MFIFFNPALEYRSLDLGFRLVLMFFLPGSIMAVLLFQFIPITYLKYVYTACALLFLYFGYFTSDIYNYKYETDRIKEYSEVVDKLKGANYLLVIAHQGLNYYYDYITKKDALAYIPDAEKYPDDLTWRITYGITYDGFMSVLPHDYVKKYPPIKALTQRYYLVREDLWKYFIVNLKENDYLREIAYSWRNPHKKKPVYVKKREIKR